MRESRKQRFGIEALFPQLDPKLVLRVLFHELSIQ